MVVSTKYCEHYTKDKFMLYLLYHCVLQHFQEHSAVRKGFAFALTVSNTQKNNVYN